MAKVQKYGIKFPITVVSDEESLFDTNYMQSDSVASELLHIVFTPRGQRLRDPEFGTSLIQFIFNPNDMQSWEDVVGDVQGAVSKYLHDCKVNDIKVLESEDGNGLYVEISYSVWENGIVSSRKTVTKI